MLDVISIPIVFSSTYLILFLKAQIMNTVMEKTKEIEMSKSLKSLLSQENNVMHQYKCFEYFLFKVGHWFWVPVSWTDVIRLFINHNTYIAKFINIVYVIYLLYLYN